MPIIEPDYYPNPVFSHFAVIFHSRVEIHQMYTATPSGWV